MKNTTPLALLLLFSFVMLFSSCKENMQSTVLEQHEAQYPNIKKKYVYQSLIRLANIKTVRNGIMGDGYEILVEGRTADTMRMSLWLKEMGPRSHYMALVEAAERDIILEVDGQINIEYLMALEVADQEALMGLIQEGF
jgi:hypothetical protein